MGVEGKAIWITLFGGSLGPEIVLSNAAIAEDAVTGALVGTLSVRNARPGSTYTFTITADPDSKFAIDGSDLETAAALDYETKTAHSVTISATDGTTTIAKTFLISVVDIAEPTGNTLLWGTGNNLEWGSGNDLQWGT